MDTKQKNKTKWILVAVIVLFSCIIVALAGICILLYKNSQNNQNDPALMTTVEDKYPPSGNAIVISEDTRGAASTIQEKVERGIIEVRMTQNWVFKDGGASSNAYLANSVRNSYDLRFEITLADTGEVILISPDVPVGSCIENFPLSVTLDPGKYDIVIAHQQVENGEVINTVRTAGTITVQ